MSIEFPLWVAAFDSEGVFVTVLMNDVTIYDRHTAGHRSFGEKINPLLMTGTNTVKVFLGLAPPLPSKPNATPRSKGPPKPSFVLKVQRGVQGVDPAGEGIAVQYEWEPGNHRSSSGDWRWFWKRALRLRICHGLNPLGCEYRRLRLTGLSLEAFL